MPAERSFRTHALILKRRDFGEADRLLTVLTPAYGKLEVIAKGARKPTSTKTGHVELFTRADLLVHRGRELDIAQQAEMVMPFIPLREDLNRGAYASYAAELMDRFAGENDEGYTDLFDLLEATFRRLCDDADLRRVTRYYELHLLEAVGFRPELNECVFSHDDLLPEDQFFSYAQGGVVSRAAAHHSNALVPLSLNALKVLRHMQRSAYPHVAALQINPALHTDLERLMLGYLTFVLERRLQSVDFIRKLRA